MSNWKPFESMKFEPETKAKLEAEYQKLLEKLGEWHEVSARGRKVQLDKDLGKAPGCMADVIAAKRSITLDTLLGFFAATGSSLRDFVEALGSRALAPSSSGQPQLPPPVSSQRLLSFVPNPQYDHLRQWAANVHVTPDGHSLGTDIRLILSPKASKRARQLAEQDLELISELEPSDIAPLAAQNLCRSIAYLASRYRSADGLLGDAAELLALAAQLEARLNEPVVRSLLYREAATLLCYLGKIAEAESYSRLAIDLALVDPHLKGLGESIYVRAMMVKWSGSPEFALQLIDTAAALITDQPHRTATRLNRVGFLYELGQIGKAFDALTSIDHDDLSGDQKGRFFFWRALIHSAQGDQRLADSDFETASSFLRFENATDEAICLLYRCTHYARYHMFSEMEDVALRLPALAQYLDSGSVGAASLVEVANQCLANQTTQRELHTYIVMLQRPWAAQSRHV